MRHSEAAEDKPVFEVRASWKCDERRAPALKKKKLGERSDSPFSPFELVASARRCAVERREAPRPAAARAPSPQPGTALPVTGNKADSLIANECTRPRSIRHK